MALSWTLDKIGPLATPPKIAGWFCRRSPASDSKDPGSAGKSFYYTPQYARPMKDLQDRLRAHRFHRPRRRLRAARLLPLRWPP